VQQADTAQAAEYVGITFERSAMPVPEVVLRHRRQIQRLANRKICSILGNVPQRNQNSDALPEEEGASYTDISLAAERDAS
jgi:hypothetical protein